LYACAIDMSLLLFVVFVFVYMSLSPFIVIVVFTFFLSFILVVCLFFFLFCLFFLFFFFFFFFQAEDGIRDFHVTGVLTCALPICFWEFRRKFYRLKGACHFECLITLLK